MKKLFAIVAIAFATVLSGCTIVDTGKVGLRVNFNKTIDQNELPAGSINQVMVGSVIEFPVREVGIEVNDLQPLAKDNATMKDVDITVNYNINPACVSDLYVNKSRSYHVVDEHGDTLLMYAYLRQTARNAVYKEAREYEAMLMNDNRGSIENGIRKHMEDTITEAKLDKCLTVNTVQARALTPPDALKNAADSLIRAKTEAQTKEVEVQIAKKESERIAALNANAGAREYMNAQANMEIAKAVREGKVHSIILPYDFKGIVNAGK